MPTAIRSPLTLRNLPAGASFNAAQAYSAGHRATTRRASTTTSPSSPATARPRYPKASTSPWRKAMPSRILAAIPSQILREGDAFCPATGRQYARRAQAGRRHHHHVELLCALAPRRRHAQQDTGWFSWTPGYAAAGNYGRANHPHCHLYSGRRECAGHHQRHSETCSMHVLNATGAPQFEPAQTWNVLEGQPLRISVFAFDPNNPDFEPKVRLTPTAPATGPDTTAATVTYQVTGLPPGASFDDQTMELVWTPGQAQAGTYYVNVIATETATAPARSYPARSRCRSWCTTPTAHR